MVLFLIPARKLRPSEGNQPVPMLSSLSGGGETRIHKILVRGRGVVWIIHPFIQQIEHLLCARHSGGCWEESSDQIDTAPAHRELFTWRRWIINKINE